MDSTQNHHEENFHRKSLTERHHHSMELYSNTGDVENNTRDNNDKNEIDYDNTDKTRTKIVSRDDTRTDDDNDVNDNDEDDQQDIGTDEKLNLLPCEHQYLLHDCQYQVPVYSKIEPSKNINLKRKTGRMAISQTGSLKKSMEHDDDNEALQTEALLEAQRHLDDMRRKRVFSHYRQYEQWRRRQFTCDPYYFYRPPTLYDYALPYSVTTPSAFRRRRQYQRQYSYAARSSYEDSQDSKDSQSSCHHGYHGHHYGQRQYQNQTTTTGINLHNESTVLLNSTKPTTEDHSVSGTKTLIVLIMIIIVIVKLM